MYGGAVRYRPMDPWGIVCTGSIGRQVSLIIGAFKASRPVVIEQLCAKIFKKYKNVISRQA